MLAAGIARGEDAHDVGGADALADQRAGRRAVERVDQRLGGDGALRGSMYGTRAPTAKNLVATAMAMRAAVALVAKMIDQVIAAERLHQRCQRRA